MTLAAAAASMAGAQSVPAAPQTVQLYPGQVEPPPPLSSSPAEPVVEGAALLHGPALGAAGRLINLARIPENQIRELIADLVNYLESSQELYRTGALPGAAPVPERVKGLVTMSTERAPTQAALRIGYVMMPRRIPQLWVDGPAAAQFDDTLRKVLDERSQTRSNLRLRELESQIIHLSYIDADDALFALRAMGYSAITDENSPLADEVASPEVAEVPSLAPGALGGGYVPPPSMNGGAGGGNGSGSGGFNPYAAASSSTETTSKFKALRNLPKTIGMDKLPLVIRMPNPERKELGLVGAVEGANSATKDQFGMTNLLPNAASDLSQTVTNGTNELLVMYHPDSPEQFQRLRHLIETTIDRPARQVYIEGLVLEINSDTLRDLGVQWSAKKGNYGLTLGALTAVPAGGSALSAIQNKAASVNPIDVLNRINALVESNKAEVLSRPSVMTIDNRQATIRIGTDIPIATSIDSSSGSGGRVSFNFQYLPTGILLNVRPRINQDGSEVSMLIDATVSSSVPNQDLKVLDSTTNAVLASAPTISTRRVQTYARIRDNMPLIIGGLVSRNNSQSTDKVPGVGEVPLLGKLFGHESSQDNKREVVVVLTPSVVTEDVQQTKAQYPKDDARFDLSDTGLMREHLRVQAEDLVDAQFILNNPRFAKYRALVAQLIKRQPGLAQQQPFARFTGDKVPGEFIFVSGLIDRLLVRHKEVGDKIDINRLIFFEGLRGVDFRPQSLGGLMARYGDGKNPMSFFERNRGKALSLTFRPIAGTDETDMFAAPVPEVSLIDCPDRDTWRRKLWDLNHPESGTRFTILIHDESDLERLKLAIALRNTINVNGKEEAVTFQHFQPGRMVQIQRSAANWEQALEGSVARNFFIGEYFYPYFIEDHERMLRELDAALRRPDVKPYLDGLSVP
jgi:general secretion pathway protein D